MELKDYLKESRIKCGLTQKQAGEKIETTTNTIQNWEYGKTYPERNLWKNIVDVYGLEIDKFIRFFMDLEDSNKIKDEDNMFICQNKLMETRRNIIENINSLSKSFYDNTYAIVYSILELMKSCDSFSEGQYTRCKNILEKSIYILYIVNQPNPFFFPFIKSNEGDFSSNFDLEELNFFITNSNGEGKMIINKFKKIPCKTKEEAMKHIEISSFFVEKFFDKSYEPIYANDIVLLNQCLRELIDIEEPTIDSE